MSYFYQFGDVTLKQLQEHEVDVKQFDGNPAPDATQDAIEQARLAAVGLIESGALGDDTHRFRISVSGHANVDHEPSPPWSNDGLSLQILQL